MRLGLPGTSHERTSKIITVPDYRGLKIQGKRQVEANHHIHVQLQTGKLFERKYRILWRCRAKGHRELEESAKASLRKRYSAGVLRVGRS